jgi:predicted TIM-barrel fold metal-dependent hydrolase
MIIDCDSHYLPLDVYKYVSDRYKKYLPTYTYIDGIPQVTGNDPRKSHANALGNLHCEEPGITDINARLRDLEKMQVDMQVVAPQDLALGFNYSVDIDLAIEMTRSYNKAILTLDPKKFIPIGYVPLQSIDAAINEMLWLRKRGAGGGINRVYVDFAFPVPGSNGCSLWRNTKDIDKFLAAAESNNVILYAHHFMHKLKLDKSQLLDNRFQPEFINGFMLDFLFTGILDRFPNLKIVIAETPDKGMGLIRALEGCIRVYNEGKYKCRHPLEYCRKNFYVTLDIEQEEAVSKSIKYFGEDKVLFSTDYPHVDPSGLNKWNDVSDLQKSSLSVEVKNKLSYQNAIELFDLKIG